MKKSSAKPANLIPSVEWAYNGGQRLRDLAKAVPPLFATYLKMRLCKNPSQAVIASSAPALETLSGHHVPTDYAMARYKSVDRNPRPLPVVL